jgi:hypothetical protein
VAFRTAPTTASIVLPSISDQSSPAVRSVLIRMDASEEKPSVARHQILSRAGRVILHPAMLKLASVMRRDHEGFALVTMLVCPSGGWLLLPVWVGFQIVISGYRPAIKPLR